MLSWTIVMQYFFNGCRRHTLKAGTCKLPPVLLISFNFFFNMPSIAEIFLVLHEQGRAFFGRVNPPPDR